MLQPQAHSHHSSQSNAETPKFDAPPPVTLVQQAITTLHHDQKSENKNRAGSWLSALQSSIYGWKVADELLLSRADVESCYFAAQTLRSKLQYSFSELPVESYVSLKDSIINHLKTINETIIQTQLALCITYLAILVPSWQNPVEEIVSKDLNRFVLVEILTLLPEELDQSRQQNLKGIGANRRQQFTQYLTKIGPQIVNLLNTIIQEAILIQQTEQSIATGSNSTSGASGMTEKLIAKIYRCLGAWITIIDPKDINLIEPLLSCIFESLKDSELCDNIHDAAADTICGAAFLCEDYLKYQQLTHYLLGQIYELENVYHRSVISEEIDKSVNYSRIFTEMAESIVEPLIVEAAFNQSHSHNPNIPGLKMVDLLLHCIGHYDYEVAEITFHFWYRFSELIQKKNTGLLPIFADAANRLLIGLTRHCQLECDQENLLLTSSDLYEFRTRVRDLIKEVVFIVGGINYLKQNHVLEDLARQLSVLQTGSADANWEVVEAQLFIISCIVRDLYPDPEVVIQMVNLVLKTQGCRLHSQIFSTSCAILGELGDWLEKNTGFLDPVLNYLLAMITSQPPQQPTTQSIADHSQINNSDDFDDKSEQTSLASIAANSLQQIIGCNAKLHLLGNVNLINVLIEICSQLDPILNETAAHNLLQCCATIISSDLASSGGGTNRNNNNRTGDDVGVNSNGSAGETQRSTTNRQQQEELVVRLLKPSVDNLNAIFCGHADQRSPCIYLNRITSVFRHLHFKEPADENSFLNQMVSQQIWPLIDRLLTQIVTTSNTQVVEKSCKCLRCIIRCLKPVWLLKPIANSIVTLYQTNPTHSPYLYLASVLVDQFGDSPDPEISSGLVLMLNAFCLPTFQLLTMQETQLRNNPDTIDDFFRLCTRFLQKNPERFLKESMLESILNLTVASISLDHRDANKSVTHFVVELLSCSKSSQNPVLYNLLQKALLQHGFGQRLMQAAVMGALFNLPTYFITEMSEIVWQLVSWDNKLSGEWLRITLATIPTQTQTGVTTVETAQLEEFYSNVIRANGPKLVASSLRFISRLLR